MAAIGILIGYRHFVRKEGIAKAFCEKELHELADIEAITVTTFREGDKADTGYRQMIKSLGFVEAELMVEFGYPTQRFILQRSLHESCHYGLQREEEGERYG